MIAVADTSPICYLVLIDEVDLLRRLFSRVVVPSAVMTELLHEDAPDAVRSWATNLPSWVSAHENPVRGVALNAFELRDGEPAGYQFQIVGDPEEDLLALFGRLVEKIRRALSIKHPKPGSLGLQVAGQVVRGRIEWDQGEEGRVPLLVIDGREITWDRFGHMLMTFEGWQFKLQILDNSEES